MVQQTRARHILIVLDELTNDTEARRQLSVLRERIVNGQGVRRARSHPLRRFRLRPKGGELGWIDPGNTVPVFERMMDSLEPSGLSEPFRTQFGWHIVQVLERRQRDGTETSRRAGGAAQAAGEEIEENTQAWVRQVRGEAYVEYRIERMTGRAPALTPGEPAGIGPDITLAVASSGRVPFVAFADPDMLRRRAEVLGLEVRSGPSVRRSLPRRRSLRASCRWFPSPRRAASSRDDWIQPTALMWCSASVRQSRRGRDGAVDGLVTAPVHKGIINDAGITFTGHTELLADLDGGARPVMMLCTSRLRVALATTHLPLRAVPDAIDSAMLIDGRPCRRS